MARKLGKSLTKGFRRSQVGAVRNTDGTFEGCRFYLAKDAKTAEAQLDLLELEWKKLSLSGFEYWPEGKLLELEKQGIRRCSGSTRKYRKHVTVEQLQIELIDRSDPLTKDQIKPILGPNGEISPLHADAVAELVASNIFKRIDVRIRLYEQLLEYALKDPINAFEYCHRNFGWGSKEAQQLLFNVNGSMSVQPLAVDDSEVIDNGDNGDNGNTGDNASKETDISNSD